MELVGAIQLAVSHSECYSFHSLPAIQFCRAFSVFDSGQRKRLFSSIILNSQPHSQVTLLSASSGTKDVWLTAARGGGGSLHLNDSGHKPSQEAQAEGG